jgi:hypothetical protein
MCSVIYLKNYISASHKKDLILNNNGFCNIKMQCKRLRYKQDYYTTGTYSATKKKPGSQETPTLKPQFYQVNMTGQYELH